MRCVLLTSLLLLASAQLDFSSSNGDEDSRLFDSGAGDAVMEVEVFDDREFGFSTDSRRLQTAGSAVVPVIPEVQVIISPDVGSGGAELSAATVTAGSSAATVMAGSGAATAVDPMERPTELPTTNELVENPTESPVKQVKLTVAGSGAGTSGSGISMVSMGSAPSTGSLGKTMIPSRPIDGGEKDGLFVDEGNEPSVVESPTAGSAGSGR